MSFLEEDCKTSLPRHFVFQSELKILDLARHGGAEFNLAGTLTGLDMIQAGTRGTRRLRSDSLHKFTRSMFSPIEIRAPTFRLVLADF